MELRRGRAHWIRTEAEFITGQGWYSVAYFRLNERPTRLICNKLASFSRSPLPAPFDDGDEMVVAGSMNKGHDLFDAQCARLFRQREIIDQNQTIQKLLGGLVLSFLAFYRIAQILKGIPIDNIGPVIRHDVGLLVFVFLMLAVGLTGLLCLGIGARLIKARLMVTSARN